MLDERTQVVHSNNPRQAALTGSFPRNSSGSDKMTLSIAIFTTHRDKHIERPYLRKKQNKKEKKNTRTLRSFFSFGVSFGLPFFLTFATADLDVSGAREASANVAVSIRPVAFIDSSSSFAEASVRACAAAAERASSDRHFYIYGQQMAAENNQNAPSLRFARMYDASVGACVVTSVCVCKQQFKYEGKNPNPAGRFAYLGPFYRERVHVHDEEPAREGLVERVQ